MPNLIKALLLYIHTIKLGMKIGGCFTPIAVVEMEQEILWKLSWNVFPPTAFCFAHQMICMLPREVPKSPTRYIVQELAKYMTELAVCVYNFVKFNASSKSFACCLVALDSLDDDCLISPAARAVFLERILQSFDLRHDDTEIRILKNELKELLCHNTDLKGKFIHFALFDITKKYHDEISHAFSCLISYLSMPKDFVALIRASNKSAHESESPKTAAIKTLSY